MGNNAKKKEAARIHNEAIARRKAADEAERIDRKENPEKYRRKRRLRGSGIDKASLFVAAAAGLGVNSF